jgi:ABC-2 type transport system ATP-binding protein
MRAIETSYLRREFRVTIGIFRLRTKEVVAVDHVSLAVPTVELFGLLGPNGQGKATIVKILTMLLIPLGGKVRVLGCDEVKQAEALRRRIRFIFGGMRDDEKVEGYSRGMKQRLHIARTLLDDPELLFLDEPTMGLDPVAVREVRQVILDLQSEKKTILLTTHYMFEADALCQRIAVINHGRIIALGTPEALKSNVRDLSVVGLQVFGVPVQTLERLLALPFVVAVSVENRDQKQTLLIQSPRDSEAMSEILASLDGLVVSEVVVREPTLEDVYVHLAGGEV